MGKLQSKYWWVRKIWKEKDWDHISFRTFLFESWWEHDDVRHDAGRKWPAWPYIWWANANAWKRYVQLQVYLHSIHDDTSIIIIIHLKNRRVAQSKGRANPHLDFDDLSIFPTQPTAVRATQNFEVRRWRSRCTQKQQQQHLNIYKLACSILQQQSSSIIIIFNDRQQDIYIR